MQAFPIPFDQGQPEVCRVVRREAITTSSYPNLDLGKTLASARETFCRPLLLPSLTRPPFQPKSAFHSEAITHPLTLHKTCHHLAPGLQQRMPNYNLQEPL